MSGTPLSSASFNIEKSEKEQSDALEEIIQAYLKYNKIGWTRSFNFNNVLEQYRSKSQEIFNYLINNPTIQQYEVMIGRFYGNGFGIDENGKIAFEWYMKASQQNNVNGHVEVGSCYFYGFGIEKNYEKAFEFYQLAANNGLNNIALRKVAHCHRFSYGTKRDLFKAFESFKKSAENGFICSQYDLAVCYEYGSGTQQNLLEALKWHKKYQENDGEFDVSDIIKKIEKKIGKIFYIFILEFTMNNY